MSVYVCVRACVYVSVCVCMYVCVLVHVCVCVSIHGHCLIHVPAPLGSSSGLAKEHGACWATGGGGGGVQGAPTELVLTDGDAKTTLELVLAVVEEGAQSQGEWEREQLLLQSGTHDPVTVHRTCQEEEGEHGGKRQ